MNSLAKNSLAKTLRSRLERLAARLHLTLILLAPPFDDDDPGAIVAAVPDLRVDWGQDLFGPRRSRLAFAGRGRAPRFTMLARLRPVPHAMSPGTAIPAHATDRNGRPVPVAVLDRASRTLHVLMDFESPGPADAEAPIDPGVLFETVFGAPIRTLLRGEGAPRIGSAFAERLRELMAVRPRDPYGDAITREIARLDSIPDRLEFLRPRARARLTELRALKAERNREPARFAGQELGWEVERLVHLVRHRAVSVIRIEDDTIHGLLNPTPFHAGVAGETIPARVFSLRLASMGRSLNLQFSDPNAPAMGDAVCPGDSRFYFPVLSRRLGVSGVVDGVLNFSETNFEASLLRLHGRLPRVARFIEELF